MSVLHEVYVVKTGKVISRHRLYRTAMLAANKALETSGRVEIAVRSIITKGKK